MGQAIMQSSGAGGLKEYFGASVDGALNTAGNVTLTSVLNGPAIVKKYSSININTGDTLTVSNPCQGLVLYSEGDVTIDGTIDMSQKAGLAPNGNIVPMVITNFKATDPYGLQAYNELTTTLKSLKGGAGGNGGYGGGNSGSTGRQSTVGIGGAGRQNLGGFGGGGSSGAIGFGYPTGIGGSIIYAESGGGSSQSPQNFGTTTIGGTDGINGAGATSPFYITSSSGSVSTGKCLGGGSGGMGAGNLSAVLGTLDGQYSGGFIAIICKGNIVISGQILCNGGNGSDGSASAGNNTGGGGGGGGAGGGVVLLAHKGTYTNNGTIQVNGGLGGSGGIGSGTGENGGPGTSGSVGTIQTQQL
jgi:hypothetical protein